MIARETATQSLKTRFVEDGVIAPLDILTSDEVLHFRNKLVEFLDRSQWQLDAVNRHKPHLYLKWANDLGRHPKIVEAVEQILGQDVMLWYSVIFVKPPKSEGFVPWHQDSTYWALSRDEGLTVWLALSEVNESNGCVEYIPGSHKIADIGHSIDNNKNNLLARGQTIKNFKAGDTRKVILKPGQCSIHDVKLLHASKANPSDQPRLGIAFRYIPADIYPRTMTWLKRSATLVSGEDKTGGRFVPDPVPRFDYDPIGLKAHRRSTRVAALHTLFGDSSRTNWRKVRDLIPILVTRKTLQYFRHLGFKIGQSNDS